MKKFTETKLFSIIGELIFRIMEKSKIFENIEPDKYECINCKRIFDKPQECQCGGTRYIINPTKYKVEGNQILCGCKKGKLNHYCHYDCYDGFIEEYRCSRCKNILSVYEYMEYEEDEEHEIDVFLDENALKEGRLIRAINHLEIK